MYAFTLERPTTLADAVKLAAAGAKPLAGGQTLLASMKLRLSAPEQLADLSGVKELTGITKEGDAFLIGAMSRHLDVANNAAIKAAYPALADLASRIGDRQVRAMGTIGGSVANNDPAACYPSAVLGSGATVVTTQREIAADEFFVGLFTTALTDGELIKAIRFPIPKRAAYGLALDRDNPTGVAKSGGIWALDTASLEKTRLWQDQGQEAWAIGWSPDGSKLLVASRQAENTCTFSVLELPSAKATSIPGLTGCSEKGTLVGFVGPQ